jgi:uncharacterized protein (DUF983 family)
MPDFMQTPLDRSYRADRARKLPISANRGNHRAENAELPASAWKAMLRGARGRCPRCDDAKLFHRFLKPVGICPACEQDWTHQQADDFPAYVAILLTGHIMAPVIIALVQETKLSLASLAAIIVTAMLVLMIGFLQPAKGAIIALQWWFGMHGFAKERRAPKKAGSDE